MQGKQHGQTAFPGNQSRQVHGAIHESQHAQHLAVDDVSEDDTVETVVDCPIQAVDVKEEEKGDVDEVNCFEAEQTQVDPVVEALLVEGSDAGAGTRHPEYEEDRHEADPPHLGDQLLGGVGDRVLRVVGGYHGYASFWKVDIAVVC